MKKLLLLLILYPQFSLADSIHSSITSYFETKNYSGSVQKNDAIVYGVATEIHHKNSTYKLSYESAEANTKQPPLKQDLNYQKLFLKYEHKINDSFELNLNTINVLHDNIAITDDGKAYGAGLTYHLNKKLSTNFTQFYSDYDDFDVYQSDLTINFKTKINGVKLGLSSITKAININEEHQNSFTKNAHKSYLTSGLKFHSHYKTYHFGAGSYFGKRAFSVMNDGFKIQHHAMEFDRTYAISLGKSIGDFVIHMQYIDQRAKELPANNENVIVQNIRFIASYKF